MRTSEAARPRVILSRAQWLRLILVGIFAAFSLARVVPDVVRLGEPLGFFGYVTDGSGVVVRVPRSVPKGSQRLQLGDRVRIDRIKPFDRKPGLAGLGFTRENFDRSLPVQRGAKTITVHLVAESEPLPSRIAVVIRIAVYAVSVALGGILFLIKPGIATFAFFIFCLGGEYPTSYTDVLFDNPWRQAPQFLGDMIRGAARAGLLLFAVCLVVEDRRAQRLLAAVIGIAGLAVGFVHAYGFWLLTYGGHPALAFYRTYAACSNVLTLFTAAAFGAALVRSHGMARVRTGYIVAAFVLAGAARVVSDTLFPGALPFWINGILVCLTIVPIAVVWVAVVRHHFFDVDWVMSRAVVYVALTGAFLGVISAAEEIGTYVFYNNTDLAYGLLIAISMIIGSFTGKVKAFLDQIVDRFIFRDRHAQRLALELIAGYVLDAETEEDVFRALLSDATHALKLSFAGILSRRPDGSYVLEQHYRWPEDCVVQLDADDELTRTIARSRGAVPLSGKETRLIRKAFPHERLTFAAPLVVEREVRAIIVYGHNVMGLDLDPDEREHLTRVVAHASLALTAIELARYRRMGAEPPAAGVSS